MMSEVCTYILEEYEKFWKDPNVKEIDKMGAFEFVKALTGMDGQEIWAFIKNE